MTHVLRAVCHARPVLDMVARMRGESDGGAPGGAAGDSNADELEAALVSELARIDFGSAMRHIRSMPEKPLRLTALLRIVQLLRKWAGLY